VESTGETRPLDLLLDGIGVTAIEETDAGLRVFFSTDRDRDLALAHLREQIELTCTAIDVPDEDWAARSQAALQPVTIGDIIVAPPWTVTDDMRARSSHLIVIQPSMGFGTGHHASTRLCLDWLRRTPLAGRAMLDVGTGSGVLAIAAASLGASQVAGIDIDPDALTAARENAELNHVQDRVHWHEIDLLAASQTLGRRFNVICANLTGGLLFRDAGAFAALALPDAHLIASGFQPEEAVHVVGAFKAAGWNLEGHAEEEDWVGVRLGFPRNHPDRSSV
jgi:ribosomal protein L11 methyltransferase